MSEPNGNVVFVEFLLPDDVTLDHFFTQIQKQFNAEVYSPYTGSHFVVKVKSEA